MDTAEAASSHFAIVNILANSPAVSPTVLISSFADSPNGLVCFAAVEVCKIALPPIRLLAPVIAQLIGEVTASVNAPTPLETASKKPPSSCCFAVLERARPVNSFSKLERKPVRAFFTPTSLYKYGLYLPVLLRVPMGTVSTSLGEPSGFQPYTRKISSPLYMIEPCLQRSANSSGLKF